MANTTRYYQGAAAIDLYRGQAARSIGTLPQDHPHPAARSRAEVSLTAVFGVLAAAVMLLLVVASYVRLYEVSTQVSNLRGTLETLQAEGVVLRNQYESKIDLANIEKTATEELGMSQPGGNQTVYINISGKDHAEVFGKKGTHPVSQAVHELRTSVSKLLTYLS